eukprot:CAMPEP_0194213958 /NCGR_PEP_ID=MMETSP0156-20130528/14916_1 /TAXON_ID=33649 /ORGANISM="Thalassionema nitzschioides, Strain L26-B" /LENGTH=484 /DNA_ID=CAMNT_0038942113 /DNA_START=113 /DNA_END=1567 /DNA_ORIENTATION=-
MAAQFVRAGACIDMSDPTFATFTCTFERSFCPPDTEFYSSRQLDLDTEMAHIQLNCNDTGFHDNPLHDVTIGICTGDLDQGLCTGDPSNCEDYAYQQNSKGVCTIQKSLASYKESWKSSPAFGRCMYGDGFCVWSEMECPEDNSYVTPYLQTVAEPNVPPCTCEKVRVGACEYYPEEVGKVNKAQVYCAVSEQSCDAQSTYIPAMRLITDDRNCFLCDESGGNEQDTPEQFTAPAPVNPPAPVFTPDTALPPVYLNSISAESNAEHAEHTQGPPPKQHATDPQGVMPPPEITMHNIDMIIPQDKCPDIPKGGCNVCGKTGTCVGNANAIFEYPGQPSVPCWELQQSGIQGLIPLALCPLLHVATKMPKICGCTEMVNDFDNLGDNNNNMEEMMDATEEMSRQHGNGVQHATRSQAKQQPGPAGTDRKTMVLGATAASLVLVSIALLVLRRRRNRRQEERNYSRDNDCRLDGPSTFEMVPMYDDE